MEKVTDGRRPERKLGVFTEICSFNKKEDKVFLRGQKEDMTLFKNHEIEDIEDNRGRARGLKMDS